MTNLFSVNNLSFCYKKNKMILKNINLTIKKGKITTILGENGCGKSTLLNIISKNLKTYTGEVIFKDKNLKSYSLKNFSKELSMVHQKNNISEEISVYDMVSFGRLPYQNIFLTKKTNEDIDAVNFALEITDLVKYKEKSVTSLSGGELQRVFIAMCLAQKTDTIILDEPTTFLDVKYQKNIMNLIKKLNTEYGYSIIMVLHDINQALSFSDEIIALKDGELLESSPAKNFYNKKLLSEIYNFEFDVVENTDKNIVVTW